MVGLTALVSEFGTGLSHDGKPIRGVTDAKPCFFIGVDGFRFTDTDVHKQGSIAAKSAGLAEPLFQCHVYFGCIRQWRHYLLLVS